MFMTTLHGCTTANISSHFTEAASLYSTNSGMIMICIRANKVHSRLMKSGWAINPFYRLMPFVVKEDFFLEMKIDFLCLGLCLVPGALK